MIGAATTGTLLLGVGSFAALSAGNVSVGTASVSADETGILSAVTSAAAAALAMAGVTGADALDSLNAGFGSNDWSTVRLRISVTKVPARRPSQEFPR